MHHKFFERLNEDNQTRFVSQEALGGAIKVYEVQEYKTILADPPKFENDWQSKIKETSSLPELSNRLLENLRLKHNQPHTTPYQDDEHDANTEEALKARFVWAKEVLIPKITHAIRVPETENMGKETFVWLFALCNPFDKQSAR